MLVLNSLRDYIFLGSQYLLIAGSQFCLCNKRRAISWSSLFKRGKNIYSLLWKSYENVMPHKLDFYQFTELVNLYFNALFADLQLQKAMADRLIYKWAYGTDNDSVSSVADSTVSVSSTSNPVTATATEDTPYSLSDLQIPLHTISEDGETVDSPSACVRRFRSEEGVSLLRRFCSCWCGLIA